MTLSFRNLDARVEDPVSSWPQEELLTALERGGLHDWRPIASEIRRQPWGRVARAAEEILTYSQPYGVAPLMEQVIRKARRQASLNEAAEVAHRVRDLRDRSGLSTAEFARAIGTSASRMSTYLTGKVIPSAGLLVRMESVSEQLAP